MKKIVSFILVLTMILTNFISVDEIYATDKVYASTSFSDVIATDWFYNNVTEMVDLGIVDGYPDGTFKPQGALTADAFIKMLIIGMGYEAKPSDSTYWADGYIQKAEELKIVDKTFVADYRYNLTREQAAKIIANTIYLKENRPVATYNEYIKNAIKDYHLITDKYKQDIIDVYSLGIMQGNNENKINPKSTITRAEATSVVLRMMNKDRRLSVVEKLSLDKFSIKLKDLDGNEYIIVAPLVDGKPVMEIIEFVKIYFDNIDKTKGIDGLDYKPSINSIRTSGIENQKKLDYLISLKNANRPLSIEELTKAANYYDYTFNVSLIDLKGKYSPYEFQAEKNTEWLDDETYKNQYDKWGAYFTEYYLDTFKPVFKLLFEKDYDKAWNMLVEGISSNSQTYIEKSEILNERHFHIRYRSSSISFRISLKNQYK